MAEPCSHVARIGGGIVVLKDGADPETDGLERPSGSVVARRSFDECLADTVVTVGTDGGQR